MQRSAKRSLFLLQTILSSFAIIIFSLTILFAVLITDKDFEGTWGIVAKQGNALIPMPTALDDMVNRCIRIARVKGLTRREEEILFLLAQNCSSSVIAVRLYLAESTVKTHVKHIYAKLGVHTRSDLVALVNKQC